MTEQNQQNSLLGKIAAYTEILAKDPASTIFVSLGEAYRKMGMLDEARKVIENGLQSHAEFSPAHIVLARILCQQGEYDSSETTFKMALEYDPESLAALVGFARLEILLGREGKARELLLQARQLSPADPVINKLILSLPEPKPVSSVEEPVVEEPAGEITDDVSAAPPLVSSTVADLYLKQGLKEQALEVYRQLSNEHPDNLLYRRKIRDLEDELTAPAAGIEKEEVPQVDEELAPTEDTLWETREQVQDTGEATAVVGNVEEVLHGSEEKVIATLNRWLDSIQRRRGDV